MAGILGMLGILFAYSQPADSLGYYLELAARNNPQINADFSLYKASLEKVPQAGAYPDPELEIGFFLKPMEILSGKQIADFTLMQMFPWFGTRKAAHNEATEMARMAYEQFRNSRNNLHYEVKSQWYQLCNINEQYKNTQANLRLLDQLEQLALNRFSAPSAKAGNSMGGMSDVLRIQMEKVELENTLASLLSQRKAAEAAFNTLLNQSLETPISVPDSLEQLPLSWTEAMALDSVISNNPMLTMLEAEGNAYRAKAEMDKKMSYPMLGVGLQYSLIGKKPEDMSMGSMSGMNGKDMFMPMLKISLPIFRKKYNAQQRESKHYWKSSELKYENTMNQLQAEYIRITQQLEDAARKIDLYRKQYDLSLATYQLIVREFSAGSTTLTDVIQVERQMLDYHLKESEAIAEYNTQIAGIEKLISTSVNK
ncbi:MAG: TolC family protein [Parabacteroides sp.]|nr:TolC family protein [Parabacteroides sp.]